MADAWATTSAMAGGAVAEQEGGRGVAAVALVGAAGQAVRTSASTASVGVGGLGGEQQRADAGAHRADHVDGQDAAGRAPARRG